MADIVIVGAKAYEVVSEMNGCRLMRFIASTTQFFDALDHVLGFSEPSKVVTVVRPSGSRGSVPIVRSHNQHGLRMHAQIEHGQLYGTERECGRDRSWKRHRKTRYR